MRRRGGAGFLRQGRYGISGRCTPKDQAVVRHWIQLCRRFRVRDEKHRPIGMPQKGLYVFGLPSAIADCDRSACAALMHSALMAEPIDHIENRAAFVCFRIQVSRVVQVRGRKKLVDRTGARAPWTFHAVVGASPPGIPRHPKTGDRNPVEQGLETHVRCHDIHPVHVAQDACRACRIAEHDCPLIADDAGQIAALCAAANLRMGLYVECRIGVLLAGSCQHGSKGVGASHAILHAGISDGLVDDQYARTFP